MHTAVGAPLHRHCNHPVHKLAEAAAKAGPSQPRPQRTPCGAAVCKQAVPDVVVCAPMWEPPETMDMLRLNTVVHSMLTLGRTRIRVRCTAALLYT